MTTEKNNSRKKIETIIIPDAGKAQPQALELEKAVLGALMLEKDAISNISDILRSECFYDKRNELIYKAITDLSARNDGVIDILTVREQLKRNGDLEAVGGTSYLAELTSNVQSSLHIDFHAKIIVQKHIARELIKFAGRVQGNAFDETIDIDDLMQDAEKGLFEIAQRNIKKDAVQIDSVISEAIKVIAKAGEQKEGISGLSSGFTALDKITSGWQNSDLIIIAARPAMGKTAFVLSMAKNMAVQFKIPVAFFSLEMSNIQLVNRLITNTCEISGDKIKSGRLERHEWKQLEVKVNDLYSAPLYVDDTPSLSVFELRSKARRLVRENGIKCIIIDYLQLMTASGMTKMSDNRQNEVSTISRSLKSLAKELNIPIIALSQLNRSVESRAGAEGKRPQLSDLRESGAIEQDADMVCFIHRPEYYHITESSDGKDLRGLAEIIVAKHRNGAIGELWLRFESNLVRFMNPSEGAVSILHESKVNYQGDSEPIQSLAGNENFVSDGGFPF
ncbi:MAG: replicative DNA helicase [Tannerella sp.]|jgi:replicative DNA helicase|nr:replicative DNA helicase [Tannerella sp.]